MVKSSQKRFVQSVRAICTHSYDLKNASPEFIIHLLATLTPNFKLFSRVQAKLAVESRDWITEFIERNGLARLVNSLDKICSQMLNENDMYISLILVKCICCIKLLLNVEHGMEKITRVATNSDANFPQILAKTCIESNQIVKKEIFQIFSAIAMFSDDGYNFTIQVLDAIKKRKLNYHRFQFLVNELKDNINTSSYLAVVIGFINCLLNQPEELKERLRLRFELKNLKIDALLETLRKREDQDLLIQINLFEKCQLEDEEEALSAHTEQSLVDMNNLQQLFDIIYLKTSTDSVSMFKLVQLFQLLYKHYEQNINVSGVLETLIRAVNDRDKTVANAGTQTNRTIEMRTKGLPPPPPPLPPSIQQIPPPVPPRHNRISSAQLQAIPENSVTDKKPNNPVSTTLSVNNSAPLPPPPPIPFDLFSNSPKAKTVMPLSSLPSTKSTNPELIGDTVKHQASNITSESKIITAPPIPPPLPPTFNKIPPPPIPPPFLASADSDYTKKDATDLKSVSVTRLALNSLHDSVPKPSKNLKTFTWKKINNTTSESNIWSELNTKTESLKLVNFEQLEEMFAKKAVASIANNARMAAESNDKSILQRKISGSMESNNQAVTFLDAKQSMNISVFLKKIKIPVTEFVQLIAAGKSKEIGCDNISCLKRIIPSSTDIEKIRAYCDESQTNLANLDKTDQFVKHLTDLPAYELRINVMHFLEEFDDLISQLQRPCECYLSSSRKLLDNESLKEFISVVLAAGNFLNSNTYNGQAVGFRIDILTKLDEIKTNNFQISFLNLIVEQLENKKFRFEFLDELKDLQTIANNSFSNLSNDFRLLKKRSIDLQNELNQSSTPKDVATMFSSSIDSCVNRINRLEEKFNEIETEKKRLIEYYCEDQTSFNIDEFFHIFVEFCNDVQRSIDENKARTANEEKIKKRKQELIEKEQKKILTSNSTSVKSDELALEHLLSELKSGKVMRKSVRVRPSAMRSSPDNQLDVVLRSNY